MYDRARGNQRVSESNLWHQLPLAWGLLQRVLQGVLQCVGKQSMAPCLLSLRSLALSYTLLHSLLQCVALSCSLLQSLLQCVARQSMALLSLRCVAGCVAGRVAVCWKPIFGTMSPWPEVRCSVCCSVFQSVALCCSLPQFDLPLALPLSVPRPLFLSHECIHTLSLVHTLSLSHWHMHAYTLSLSLSHTHTHTFPLCLPPPKKNKQKMSWLSLFHTQRFCQCCVCDKEIVYHTHWKKGNMRLTFYLTLSHTHTICHTSHMSHSLSVTQTKIDNTDILV